MPGRLYLPGIGAALLVLLLGMLYIVLPERPSLAAAPSPAWSRAVDLGAASPANSPALAVHPDGGASVVWVYRDGKDDRLAYARLSATGNLMDRHPLAIASGHAQSPRLRLDGAGRLHLAWLETDPQGGRRASYVQLDQDGTPGLPVQVSPIGKPAGALDLFVTPDGAAGVLWSGAARGDEGIYITRLPTRLDPAGHPLGEPVALDPIGVFPSVQVDRRGAVHAVWLRSDSEAGAIVYGRLDAATGRIQPTPIAVVPPRQIYPPVLGLDATNGYILWQQWTRRADGRIADETLLATFRLDRPGPSPIAALQLADPPSPDYQAAGEVPARRQVRSMREPAVAPGQHDGLAFTVSALLANQRHKPTLLVQGVLKEGRPVAYRLGTLGRFASIPSTIAEDDTGSLHLAWLEGRGESDHRVRWATTAPAAVRALAGPTREDFRSNLVLVGVAAAATLAFTPALVALNALAFGLLALLSWRGEASRLVQRYGTPLAIALQTFVYVAIGQALVQSGTFAEWVPAPIHHAVTAIVYPLACTAVGIAACALVRARKGEGPGTFSTLAVFALASGWAAGLGYFLYLLPRL